jgi:hypothetical protein
VATQKTCALDEHAVAIHLAEPANGVGHAGRYAEDLFSRQVGVEEVDRVRPVRDVRPGFRSWISREYLWARIRGVGPGDAQAEAVTAGVGSSA